jgi:hypothetical protein
MYWGLAPRPVSPSRPLTEDEEKSEAGGTVIRLRLRRYRRAERDVTEQVACYVDQGKVGTADRFIDALEKAFRRLSPMPELGPVISALNQ